MADILLVESPLTMIESETITFNINWQGARKLSLPGATVYLKGENITDEVMPKGKHKVSGSVQTLRPLTPRKGDAGEKYVLKIQVDEDGVEEKRKLMINIVGGTQRND